VVFHTLFNTTPPPGKIALFKPSLVHGLSGGKIDPVRSSVFLHSLSALRSDRRYDTMRYDKIRYCVFDVQ